ncbi:MATE family efflux transporter [Bianquea renquensis]|jgi:MATE efflux family protein|uniref:Multidrug export protein MepA n=1 Tax=Bianquea renquensis TaxID=2763661 RepID=A0A926DW56_9FIRM|nr:MATE family efflux transporter [Bianquea renquensis]MBC8545171.1 MATE family efflux transporter [Bianquea renquensis]
MNTKTKSLFGYIFPALGGLFVTYLYNVVDGIFVGQGVGSAALGAVNIGVPFITFVVAVAAMFPMGGATVVAIRMGRGDKDGANHTFMTAFSLTVLLSATLMIVGMVFSQQIVDLSGAKNLSAEMREMSAQYLFYYSAFSIPMLMSTCLSVFIRNDGSPALAFVGMCVGAAANIFLDWLFIFPLDMGVIGAAVASGLGQIFSVLVLLIHFLRKKGELRIMPFKIDFSLIKKICKRGVPEAVTQLTTPVTALCYNLMLASLIGDIGISTFSVLSFIYSLANAILSGVAQGLQPLWGHCYGKQDTEEMGWYFRSGIIINLVLSILIYGGLFFLDVPVIRIFNKETALVQTATAALPIFSLSFIPMALNLIFTAFLFSTKRTGVADVIAISRGIIVKALAIFCIPILFGSNAIWIAPFVAETITLVLAVVLSKTSKLAYQ